MMKLKAPPAQIKPFIGRSDALTATSVPVGASPRAYYMRNSSDIPPPYISSSEFVPMAMIEHLMRNKKGSALGVKFQAKRTPPDQVTNMEGAMHTFVTPLMQAYIHGDYIYRGGHGMIKFPPMGDMQQARVVIVSAQIQPDFEGPEVMLALAVLKHDPIVGLSLPDHFAIPEAAIKQVDKERILYDISLRRHMIQNLTKEARLPSTDEAVAKTTSSAVGILEDFILRSPIAMLQSVIKHPIQLSNGRILSFELLFNTAVHQLRNELSALEALCPQGYVYTSDPPSIFAQKIGATLLNRIQFAALRYLASENRLVNMKAFGFNDYADAGAIELLKAALSNQSHVKVVPKRDLFKGPRDTYAALPGTEGSLLVIHNNSDGFGQNIETEWESGSMDGAIGCSSSAAASLKKDRADLVSNLM